MSTSSDLTRWDNALLSGAVLNNLSLGMMFSPSVPAPQRSGPPGTVSSYGMGWYINSLNGGVEMEHDGEISGYSAENFIAQYQGHTATVVILTASDDVPNLVVLARNLATLALT